MWGIVGNMMWVNEKLFLKEHPRVGIGKRETLVPHWKGRRLSSALYMVTLLWSGNITTKYYASRTGAGGVQISGLNEGSTRGAYARPAYTNADQKNGSRD